MVAIINTRLGLRNSYDLVRFRHKAGGWVLYTYLKTKRDTNMHEA